MRVSSCPNTSMDFSSNGEPGDFLLGSESLMQCVYLSPQGCCAGRLGGLPSFFSNFFFFLFPSPKARVTYFFSPTSSGGDGGGAAGGRDGQPLLQAWRPAIGAAGEPGEGQGLNRGGGKINKLFKKKKPREKKQALTWQVQSAQAAHEGGGWQEACGQGTRGSSEGKCSSPPLPFPRRCCLGRGQQGFRPFPASPASLLHLSGPALSLGVCRPAAPLPPCCPAHLAFLVAMLWGGCHSPTIAYHHTAPAGSSAVLGALQNRGVPNPKT